MDCKNGELQDILSQYPKDAMVAVEYCDVKNLKYFPDRKFYSNWLIMKARIKATGD